MTVFARAARRPHIPREKWMRKLYIEAGIELPEGPPSRMQQDWLIAQYLKSTVLVLASIKPNSILQSCCLLPGPTPGTAPEENEAEDFGVEDGEEEEEVDPDPIVDIPASKDRFSPSTNS